jgi:hypothetical protein
VVSPAGVPGSRILSAGVGQGNFIPERPEERQIRFLVKHDTFDSLFHCAKILACHAVKEISDGSQENPQ